MNILSVYSKIQLKIEKAEEGLAKERSDKRSDSGVCYSLDSLRHKIITDAIPLKAFAFSAKHHIL